MNFDKTLPDRRSIRLKEYDYSQAGAHFLTICAHNRKNLFGEIMNAEMRLNSFGNIVKTCWDQIPHHHPYVEPDAFVVMPNHVHGVIVLTISTSRAGLKPAPTKTLPARRHGVPEIIRAFKTFSSRRINELRKTAGTPVWQRNYFEHIIRNEQELTRIQEYIITNPLRWALDRENPEVEAPLSIKEYYRKIWEDK